MINATTRHQIFLQRYAGTQTKQLLAFIYNLQHKIDNLMPGTELNKVRYVKMLTAFKEYADALTKSMVNGVTKDLKELVKYEAAFTDRIINQAANSTKVGFETVVPTTAQLNAAAFTSIIDTKIGTGVGAKTVGDTLEKFGVKIAGAIINSIRQGYATGQTNQQISDNIAEIALQKITKNQANAVARTVTNYVSNSAKESFYQENSDLITGYQVVATLDDRTTLECAALDGQVFDKDSFEAPPYHWGCRSTYIGVIDPKYSVSSPGAVRPSRGSDGTEEVKASTTYNTWLRDQSDDFIKDVLGAERGQMFIDGASVQSFVDHNYAPINLDELKAKDGEHNT
jgi:SPP1 gp7 family putative phage head morphogenesis protein